jgi:hypothetical protein
LRLALGLEYQRRDILSWRVVAVAVGKLVAAVVQAGYLPI